MGSKGLVETQTSCAIAVMAKASIPGRAKTRLNPLPKLILPQPLLPHPRPMRVERPLPKLLEPPGPAAPTLVLVPGITTR
jgi:hypothetical protein